MRSSSVGLSRSIFNRQRCATAPRRRSGLNRNEVRRSVVAEALEPRLLLTSLFTDSFGNGSISNPPYTTTTANGATIAETAALTANIAHRSPAATDAAYISRSDGVAAQGLPSGTGVGAVFTNFFNLDFTNFFITPISGVSPKNTEWITPFRMDPSVGNNAVASMGISYSDYLSNLTYNITEGVEYGGGNQGAVSINTSTFQAHPKQTVEIDTTVTNNGSRSWTISNVLTVTDTVSHVNIVTVSKSTTATAGDSTFNPILYNNTVRYGDYAHLRGDTNYELSGSYAETAASDAVVTTAPAAPTGLAVNGGTNLESLAWTASPGAASYNVYRGTDIGNESLLLTTGITTTTYNDTTAAAGTTYYYKVTTVGAAGSEGLKSNEAYAITIPGQPAGLATTNGTTTETLTWTVTTGASSYIIYRGPTSGSEAQIGTSSIASYNDSNLASGTNYYYQVAAVDASGTSIKSGELTTLTIPGQPSGLNAVGGNLSIQLTWTATTGAASYNIYRSTTSGGELAVTGTSTTPSYYDTGLSAGPTYYYKVAAVDASGTGLMSNESSAAPLATLATPTNFTATQTAGLGIPLTWTNPTGNNQTGFQIDRADDANFSVNVVTFTISSATATSYTDATVLANSEYYYRIRATNGASSSPNSATAGVVARGLVPLGGNIELGYNTFANIMNGAGQVETTSQQDTLAKDANGNPLDDFIYVSYETFEPGVWNITFQDAAAVTAGVPPVISATLFRGANIADTGGATITKAPTYNATGTYRGTTGYYSAQLTITAYADGTTPTFGFLTFTKTLGNLTNLSIVHPGYNPLTPPLYTNTFLNYLQNLSPQSIRYMDASHTNGSVIQNWSDHTLPNSVLPDYHTITATLPYQTPSNLKTFSNVWTGYAWEWLIQLSNLTHTDMWINIPVEATADYVTNLANLLKYGSDANGNVYTSTQANPYWAPLDPNLNIYVEYSNEVWNTGFIQFNLNLALALTEQTTNQNNIDWDGASSSQWTWAARRLDEQTALISQEFAAVWGQSAINTTIRPVNAYQPGQIGTIEDQLSYLANKSPFGSDVSTYIYGQAVAQYLTLPTVNDDNPNLTAVEVNTDLEANFNQTLNPVPTNSTANNDLQNFTEASFYGLHPLAYEGGPALGGSPLATVNSNHLAGNAVAERNPNFAQTTQDALNTWFTNGGGLLEYYSFGFGSFGSKYGDWPISESVSDQNSPKELGYIATRNETALPVPSASQGYFASFPGELDARDYLSNKLAVGSNAPAEWTGTSIPNSAGPRNYVIDSPTAQTVQLKISACTSVSGGTTLPIYLNGTPIYTSATNWLAIAYSSAGVFSDSATVTLHLQAGLNVIRLVYGSASGITTNSLKFSNSAGIFVSNTLPNIGTVTAGVSVLEGVNHTATFTVSDVETPLSQLSVTISSTNLALYPTANISISTTAPGTWSYSVTPVAGLTGTANIVFTITDGGGLVRSDALPFTVTPSAPTSLAASAGPSPQSQVNLTWVNTSTAYTQTKVDVSTSSTFSNTAPDVTLTYFAPKGATRYTVGGLTQNQTYYFRVSAYDNAPNDEEASAYTTGTVSLTTASSSNSAPTVTTPAAVTNTVNINNLPYIVGTTANLSVAFSGTGTITWVLMGTPQAAVSFSNNNSSSASTTTATFTKAGSGSYPYKFGVYLTDANGLSAEAFLTVSVQQTAASFTLSPTSYSVTVLSSVQLAPTNFIDQFGNPMAVTIDRNNNQFSAPPQVQYTLQPSPLGKINVSTNSFNTNNGFGLYNAPATGIGTDTTTLTAGFLPVTGTTTSGSTTITLTSSTNTNGFLVGDYVLGAGIPSNDKIASIVSATSFTLTTAATVSATNVSILAGQALTTATITVTAATPTITWNTPAPITYGTALTTTQLNATASVPGTFIYTPPVGTILTAGNSKTLSVTFTPTDTTDYNNASASVSLTVNKAATTTTIPIPTISTRSTSVNLSAQVAATPTVNQGTITFSILLGAMVIATGTSGTVSNGAASALLALSGVSEGSFTIQASYVPDPTTPNYTASSATTQGQVLDATAPTSHVAALPSITSQLAFPVTWSGQDDAGGSGIARYSIYVSINGGQYQPWLTSTTLTTATYTGQDDHAYAFYSQALDLAGNLQPAPSAPDATTHIDTWYPTPEITIPTNTVATWSNGWRVSTVTVGSNAHVTLPSTSTTTLEVKSLSLATGSTLDLNAHDLVIRAGSLATAMAWATSGQLTSSVVTTSSGLKQLAVISGAEYISRYGVTAQFGGLSVNSTDVLVMTALKGDANLDGRISADDYLALDSGYLFGLTGYTHGDFNLNGTIDAADYAAIDYSYAHQGAHSTNASQITLHTQMFGAAYTAALAAQSPPPATHLIVTGPDAGDTLDGPLVKVFDAATGNLSFSFLAYDKTFLGAVRVALGDFNTDGTPDIVTATGAGGQPLVNIYDGKTGSLIRNFYAYSPDFLGGVQVAVADVTGSGHPDIITSTDAGGMPLVNVFDSSGTLLLNFYAYDPNYLGGVRIASGDFAGDGKAEIVTSTANGGQPLINVFNPAGTLLGNFWGDTPSYTGGLQIAIGDFTSDGIAKVATYRDQATTAQVKLYNLSTQQLCTTVTLGDSTLPLHLRLAATIINSSTADLITVPMSGNAPDIEVFSGADGSPIRKWSAYASTVTTGLFVAAE